ncbi:MAG: hypothetical protein AAF725_10095 [Acidobacteriota bacterium]
MRKILLRSSAVALGLLAGAFLYEPQTEAALPFEPPVDYAQCYYAGVDAYCDGVRRAYIRDGGATLGDCYDVLGSLIGQLQMQGCTVFEPSVTCEAVSEQCRGQLPPQDDDYY